MKASIFWMDICQPNTHLVSKLVRRPIYTDDEVSSVQFMAAGHARLFRHHLGIQVYARLPKVSEVGVSTGLVIY